MMKIDEFSFVPRIQSIIRTSLPEKRGENLRSLLGMPLQMGNNYTLYECNNGRRYKLTWTKDGCVIDEHRIPKEPSPDNSDNTANQKNPL